MEPLIERMKILLATQFAFYLKLHFFHWNVTGPNFPQYHDLFGDLYEEVWGSVDEIAEHIRAIKGFAPGSFSRYMDMSQIKDQVDVIPAEAMINQALQDNQIMIDQLNVAFRAAEQAGEIGLANYIQDRIDIHKKHGWKLRATLG
jgi:starvation-inducible DNA-binding protein